MAIDRQGIIDALIPDRTCRPTRGSSPAACRAARPARASGGTFDSDAAGRLEAAGGWPEGETLVISLSQDYATEQFFKAIGDSIQAVLGIPYELNPTPGLLRQPP